MFYDPDHIQIPAGQRPERLLIRFVKTLMRAFDDMTADGYIFRTDLRLRPDPRSNAIAVSTRTAERYYESFGQNWERSAMIKARFVGGDEAAAHAFIDNTLRPFVWRRTLDYAAIADIHSIKRQINQSKRIDDMQLPGHNIKLGLGGIREIELFVSVQQLILGGRHKELRTPRTVDALQKLVAGGFVDPAHGERLTEHYARLRLLEHRVQMHRDEQTHIWPTDRDKREDLGLLCGASEIKAFEADQVKIFREVHEIYGELFAEEDDLASEYGNLVFTGVEAEPDTLATLSALGYTRGPEVWTLMADWLGGRIRATRTPRARELLTRLAPRIITACAETGAADTAFFSFADFITRLNAGVSLLSLLVNRDDVLTALIKILALSPKQAEVLAKFPGQIEGMLHPDFGSDAYFSLIDYRNVIEEPFDLELAMNALRRAVHEDQLSLTAMVLNRARPDKASAAFSEIAEKAVDTACEIARRDTEARLGPMPGEYAVIGMGKLGGRELSLSSDLDLVIVYSDPGAQDWFNRFSRRLISVLSSVTHEGVLYEIDMALRPSGRAGPLSVPLDAFVKYYESDAWTWEFLALTKARIVNASSPEFATKVRTDIREILAAAPGADTLKSDVKDMLERLARDKPARHDWDIKRVAGGLRTLEFIAQTLALETQPQDWPTASREMIALAPLQGLDASDTKAMVQALDLYTTMTQMLAIVGFKANDLAQAPKMIRSLLADGTGHQQFEDLQSAYMAAQADVQAISQKLFTP